MNVARLTTYSVAKRNRHLLRRPEFRDRRAHGVRYKAHVTALIPPMVSVCVEDPAVGLVPNVCPLAEFILSQVIRVRAHGKSRPFALPSILQLLRREGRRPSFRGLILPSLTALRTCTSRDIRAQRSFPSINGLILLPALPCAAPRCLAQPSFPFYCSFVLRCPALPRS